MINYDTQSNSTIITVYIDAIIVMSDNLNELKEEYQFHKIKLTYLNMNLNLR